MAPILFLRQKALISRFLSRGIVNESNAVSSNDGLITNSVIFTSLVKRGVIVRTIDGRYYINQSVNNARNARIRLISIIGLFACFIYLIVIYFI